jgi:Holliday junction DNA helicase RuvA
LIAGIRGHVLRVEAGGLVLSVGPVDVRVLVPASLASNVAPGQEVNLRTYLHVREDRLDLYGFASDGGLEAFALLLTVSGVGPKLALGVLSALEPKELSRAISRGDTQAIARAPGVGSRAASRIVTDLQSKFAAANLGETESADERSPGAVAALIAMGYSPSQARDAVASVAASQSVEDTLRAALSVLGER